MRKLMDEQIFFSVAQFQAREGRNAIDIRASQPFRHAKCYHAHGNDT